MRKRSDVNRPWRIAKVLVVAALLAGVFTTVVAPKPAVAVAPTTVPNTVSFQGKIVNFSDGTNVADGTYSVTFKLYDAASAGTQVWGETQASVSVVGGVFQVNLGSTCSFFITQTCSTFSNTAIDFSTGPALYLTMKFAADTQETSPRIPLQSVPFAFNAETANKLGGLTSSQYIQLAQGVAQTDASTTAPSIFLNKTNASGTPNILQVQKSGTDAMVLDNSGNLLLGASSGSNILTMVRAVNALTVATISNTNGSSGAAAGFTAYNNASTGFGFFGIGGTGYTTIPILQNRAAITTGSATSGIVLNAAGASQNILFAINGTEVARFDSTGTFLQAGANAFTTGTGAVSLNGDTTVASGKNLTLTNGTLTVTTGNLAINSGNVTVSGTYNGNTFTSSTLTFSAASANSINGTSGQNLTLQSQGAGQLILNSANGTLGIASTTTTLQRIASGSLTVDLNNAANTSLLLQNSASGVANLNLSDGVLQTATTTRLDNGGNLLNIGTISASGLETLSGTGGTMLAVTGAPAVSATSSLIQIGSAIAGGNAVANGGTYLGINTAASGAGSVADVFNFQVAGTSVLKQTTDGNLYGNGFDVFDPSLMSGATTSVGNYSAGGSFGTAFSAGAFIDNTDIYSSEFVASLASATTNNRNIGDSTNWYFNNAAAVTGQATSQDISTTGGFIRMGMAATTARGALVSQGATPGTPDKPLNAANLPIIQMKARPSVVRVTDDFFWGAMDTATPPTANDTLPANGFFFWTNNSTGAGGWTGVVRSASATIGTPVVCPGGITAGAFATGRIVVVNATTVRFMIDVNASDGINFQDCGTVTGTLPAADVALQSYVTQTTNTTANFDIDYARFWQDDAPTSASDAAQVVQTEQTQADLSTEDVATETPDALAPPAEDAETSPIVDEAAMLAAPDQVPNTSVELTGNSLRIFNAAGQSVGTIDDSGSANFSGNLNIASASVSGGLSVAGDATFAGLSTFQKLATFLGKTIFRQDVQFEAHIAVANDTAGYATLAVGESKVHVSFNVPYETAPLVTVNISDGQFGLVTVANVTKVGFDILIPEPATTVTKLTWLAVAVTSPQTASNPPPTIQ